jgi:Protein kinase domain
MQFNADGTVGPWTLIEPLGEGGNSEVWIAKREGEERRALKILRDRRPAAVPYQRFRREIDAHRRLGQRPDVVPMLDWSLPEEPSKRDRAWMSMPIAVPVREALQGKSLEEVVAATASFANTLAEIAAEYGMAHRDVKPGNLYLYEKRWAVGDLGLIDVPGAETLTEPDRIVGPANFVAYEMMVEADRADPHLADVYSLAKTLWVLSTEQTWPPPGHQPAVVGALGIGSFRAHPRAAELDQIVDRCTRASAERPALLGLAEELDAWLAATELTEPGEIDIGDIAASIRSSLAPQRAEEERAEQRRADAQSTADLLSDALDPLIAAVEREVPDASRVIDEKAVRTLVLPMEAIGTPAIEAYWLVGVRVVGPGRMPIAFRMMSGLSLLDDGQIYLAGAYLVAPERTLGSAFNRRYEPFVGIPDGLASEQAVVKLAGEMSEDLRPALQAFSELV